MKTIQDIVALLQQTDVPPEDWPATMALAYVMASMVVLERTTGDAARARAQAALWTIVDEARDAIQEWTPDADASTQLAARFSGRLGEQS